MKKNTVVLLNNDYTPLSLITWKKAIKLIFKKKVEIIKETKNIIHNFEKTKNVIIPEVIKLLKHIKNIFKIKVPFNKKNLLIRDDKKCQYCGCDLKEATIDHVIPKTRGGKTNWENCVISCLKCNNKKDNKLCNEIKMFPKNKPYVPTVSDFILKQMNFSLENLY